MKNLFLALAILSSTLCTAQLTVNVTSSSNVLCYGGNTGTATATATGGTSPYSFLWSDGETTGMATALFAGVNIVTVTDLLGATSTAIVLIAQPTAVEISNLSTTNVDCYGAATGAASLSYQGGTPTNGYFFQWSGSSSSSENAFGLAAGIHTVTITDGNGCFDVDTFTITQPPTGLTGYLASASALCFGSANGQLGAIVSGTPTPYSYSWNSNPPQTTVVADSLPAGTYTVTVTDADGCILILSGAVGQPSPILVNADVQQHVITCPGGSDGIAVADTASGGTPGLGYIYVWTDPTSQTGMIATGLSAGVVSIVVTDANGCTASSSVTITEPPLLTLSAINNHDGTATATTGGGTMPYTYLWDSNANNQTTAIATGLADSIIYFITVTDVMGCQIAGSTASVGIHQIPTLESFDLFPNPSSGAFYINLLFKQKQEGLLEIRDILGQLILSERFEGQEIQRQINLEKYAAGVYFISLQVEGQILTKKISIAF